MKRRTRGTRSASTAVGSAEERHVLLYPKRPAARQPRARAAHRCEPALLRGERQPMNGLPRASPWCFPAEARAALTRPACSTTSSRRCPRCSAAPFASTSSAAAASERSIPAFSPAMRASRGARGVARIWRGFEIEEVLRLTPFKLLSLPARLLGFGRSARPEPAAEPGAPVRIPGLLDFSPLERVILDRVPWRRIGEKIARRRRRRGGGRDDGSQDRQYGHLRRKSRRAASIIGRATLSSSRAPRSSRRSTRLPPRRSRSSSRPSASASTSTVTEACV